MPVDPVDQASDVPAQSANSQLDRPASAWGESRSRPEGTGLAASLAEILTDAIQELIEAELSARIGAEPHERTLARSNLRDGHRSKTV